jgi:hypothetical protein
MLSSEGWWNTGIFSWPILYSIYGKEKLKLDEIYFLNKKSKLKIFSKLKLNRN